MLQVVIDGFAPELPGKLSREQSFEIDEGLAKAIGARAGPRLLEQFLDGVTYGRNRTHLHGVRDIVITASKLHGCGGKNESFIISVRV